MDLVPLQRQPSPWKEKSVGQGLCQPGSDVLLPVSLQSHTLWNLPTCSNLLALPTQAGRLGRECSARRVGVATAAGGKRRVKLRGRFRIRTLTSTAHNTEESEHFKLKLGLPVPYKGTFVMVGD